MIEERDGELLADPARGPRRLLIALLVTALAGAVAAGALAIIHDRRDKAPAAAPLLFSQVFRQPGFLAGAARLETSYTAAPATRRAGGSVELRSAEGVGGTT